MEISEYQKWLEAWDRARGWERVSPSHTLIHAMEELGEVADLILQWEGYKDADHPGQLTANLEEEIADVFNFLFKLAYQTGVDVETALARSQAKVEGRYDNLVESAAMLDRYHARQRLALEEMLRLPDRADDNRGSAE